MTHTTEMMVEQETMQMLLAYTVLLTKFERVCSRDAAIELVSRWMPKEF